MMVWTRASYGRCQSSRRAAERARSCYLGGMNRLSTAEILALLGLGVVGCGNPMGSLDGFGADAMTLDGDAVGSRDASPMEGSIDAAEAATPDASRTDAVAYLDAAPDGAPDAAQSPESGNDVPGDVDAGPACGPPLQMCGNACVAVTTADHCGSCATVCAAGMQCASGSTGYVCSIPAPRPIAPLSTATATSQTPTLHWALATGIDGAHVEIYRDRACTPSMLITSFDVTGSSAAPGVALPPGIAFWRLAGRSQGATGAAFSPVWELFVGARSAPVNSSWGTVADVNGDGFADVVVGTNGSSGDPGWVYVYHGGPNGIASTPTTTLVGPSFAHGSFGESVASAGDVNGDGYADVVVGGSYVNYGAGQAYVYLGSATGVSSTPATTLTGVSVGDHFGASVASAGDVNGDGYADLVVGAYSARNSAGVLVGQASVYLGSADGVAQSPATVLTGTNMYDGVGGSVASAGDVNGDGFGDIVVGATGAANSSGTASVFLGSALGVVPAPATVLTGSYGQHSSYGGSVACAGDVNGDGYADIAVGATEDSATPGVVEVYFGGANGLVATSAIVVQGQSVNSGFGGAVAGAGDVNQDGYADLLVAAQGENGGVGAAYVFLGSTQGIANAPTTALLGPSAGAAFGRSVAGAGDVDGDGRGDILVGAPHVGNGIGQVNVYRGGINGVITAAPTILTAGMPAGVYPSFGQSVAAAVPRRPRSVFVLRVL